MKIVRPAVITESMLTSSNIAETDAAEWSSVTAYTIGQLVMVTGTGGGAATATHKIYKCLQNDTGSDPTDQETNSGIWLEVSATNRWKMFDQRVGDQATNAASIDIQLTFSEIINSIGLFNLDAADLTVVVTDGTEGGVYNETFDLVDNSAVVDEYTYFFEPIIRLTEIALFDLPNYSDITIDLTLTVPSGNAKVGEIVLGRQRLLGTAVLGTSVGIIDYSRKETDDFGVSYLLKRDSSYKVDFDVRIENKTINSVRRVLSDFRATNMMWSGVSDGDNLGTLVYGYYQDFNINIATSVISDCTIQVRGLT